MLRKSHLKHNLHYSLVIMSTIFYLGLCGFLHGQHLAWKFYKCSPPHHEIFYTSSSSTSSIIHLLLHQICNTLSWDCFLKHFFALSYAWFIFLIVHYLKLDLASLLHPWLYISMPFYSSCLLILNLQHIYLTMDLSVIVQNISDF